MLADILANLNSLTGQYLSGQKSIPMPESRRTAREGRVLKLINASGNNLKNVTLELPTGIFVCVTGVSRNMFVAATASRSRPHFLAWATPDTFPNGKVTSSH